MCACCHGPQRRTPNKGFGRAAAVVLYVISASLQCAAGQLVDKPLALPGRQRPGVTVAAAGAPDPQERYGYFSMASTPNRKLFYWFYQARTASTGAPINSSTTPLIAWFNGGPGCSSLWGMFFENGPWTLNADLQLVANPQTWATVGHMLYIDQPIGTGLSFSTKNGDGTFNQSDVGQTVMEFFQSFLKSSTYSWLRQNPLYLTGESFAGHYLPAIAATMKLRAPAMNLRGVAMGNPCVNGPAMYQSYLDYAVANALVDQATYKSVGADLASCKLQSAVCSVLDRSTCDAATSFCEGQIWGGLSAAGSSRLDSVNVYNIRDTAKDCNGDPPSDCYRALDQRAEKYINTNKARLGAPASLNYVTCADWPYYRLFPDMAASYDDLVAALLDNGVAVMVYSGDDDFVCNWMSSRQWLDGLVWGRQVAWSNAPVQSWAGGTFRRFGPLSFVRVARAGHMVPLDQPVFSLQMLRQWIINGQPTATPGKSRKLQGA